MIRANGKRRGFTLIELLVVIGMIAVILGALTTSVSSAQNRARINKATNDVKVISQAILAYEDWSKSELRAMTDEDADSSTLSFLLGDSGSTRSGEQLPALLMASLRSGGKILDPWGHVYKVSITKRPGDISLDFSTLNAGFGLPNFYRVSDSERKVIWEGQQ